MNTYYYYYNSTGEALIAVNDHTLERSSYSVKTRVKYSTMTDSCQY